MSPSRSIVRFDVAFTVAANQVSCILFGAALDSLFDDNDAIIQLEDAGAMSLSTGGFRCVRRCCVFDVVVVSAHRVVLNRLCGGVATLYLELSRFPASS